MGKNTEEYCHLQYPYYFTVGQKASAVYVRSLWYRDSKEQPLIRAHDLWLLMCSVGAFS